MDSYTSLLNRRLQFDAEKDIIIDRVCLPPNTELSKRRHPGETFVYVMQGAIAVTPDAAEETLAREGELVAVPYQQIYSARTTEDGATLLMFRVYEAEQPKRVMVE